MTKKKVNYRNNMTEQGKAENYQQFVDYQLNKIFYHTIKLIETGFDVGKILEKVKEASDLQNNKSALYKLFECTSQDFVDFMELAFLNHKIELGKRYLKKNLLADFNQFTEGRNPLNRRTFIDYLRKYAEYKVWLIDESPSNGNLFIKFLPQRWNSNQSGI